MNFRLTIALIVVLAALSIAVYFLSRPGGTAPVKAQADAVFATEPKALTTISLSRGNAVAVAFQKEAEEWVMTAPVKSATAHYAVASLADTLTDLRFRDKFKPEASGRRSLEAVGLASPQASLKFTDTDGVERTLLIGKHSPTGGVYVRVGGDSSNTVYEVNPQNWYDQLDGDPAQFRSRELFTIDTEHVTALGIGHPDETVAPVELVKSAASGKWVVQRPVSTRASAKAVANILEQLRNLRIDTFEEVKRDNPATGLAKPRLTVKFFESAAVPATAPAATGPATQPKVTATTIDFGYATDLSNKQVYAALTGSPEVVSVSMDTYKQLNKELNDLRDPAVTPAPVAEATSIEILTRRAADAAGAGQDDFAQERRDLGGDRRRVEDGGRLRRDYGAARAPGGAAGEQVRGCRGRSEVHRP